MPGRVDNVNTGGAQKAKPAGKITVETRETLQKEFENFLHKLMVELSKDTQYQQLLKASKHGNFDHVQEKLDAALTKKENVRVKKFVGFLEKDFDFLKDEVIRTVNNAFAKGEKNFSKTAKMLGKYLGEVKMLSLGLYPAGQVPPSSGEVKTLRPYNLYQQYLNTQPKSTPAAAAASATLKKATQGLQNLEDTSYGKAPAADAQKPTSGKPAKIKAPKKPSGGARKHDPNAKNVRGKRARTSSKFTRWGTRVLKWEIEK